MLKSLIALFEVLLQELGERCRVSTTHDYKTVVSRIEAEGLSFLTITLADFGKDFQQSLASGHVAPDAFLAFRKRAGLPVFLRGFLELVFDTSSCMLLDNPDVDAIHAVRQLTLMWSKINLPCSEERVKRAISRYVECEQDVRLSDARLLSPDLEAYRLEDFRRVSLLLWAELFSSIDTRIYNEGLVPKHGPGATADKLRGNAKYNQRMWTRRLEEVFPHWEHLIPSESFLERTDGVTILEPRDEIPVKVITVPKTLKTPRIIAEEPTCMQYMQQGVLSVMMEEIARFDNSRDFVMFESQEPNQRLAREGSITGHLATLDLSEASDRVSNLHVRELLWRHSLLRKAVDVTRSQKADVPGHGVMPLAKFASMGSALCFPFEALVFATVVFVGIERALGQQLTRSDVNRFRGKVRVYGDDIIVPTDFASPVIEELEAFGFKVGRDKSFWTGKFRESCGADFYDGHDVSIVRCRSLLPNDRGQAGEIVSTASMRNQFFMAGLWQTARHLDAIMESLIPWPVVEPTSSLLGRVSSLPCQGQREHRHLHHPLVKGAYVTARKPASPLDDYGALMKWFLKQGDEPFADEDHLQFAGRPTSVRIKLGWRAPW